MYRTGFKICVKAGNGSRVVVTYQIFLNSHLNIEKQNACFKKKFTHDRERIILELNIRNGDFNGIDTFCGLLNSKITLLAFVMCFYVCFLLA